MSKFKVGDRVRRKDDLLVEDVVIEIPGMEEYDSIPYIHAEGGFVLRNNGWNRQDEWETIKSIKTLEDITTLESGDIITDGDLFREILEVGKQTILVSNWTAHPEDVKVQDVADWIKPSTMEGYGYEIYTPEETDDKTEEAMKLLKDKGYKIVKE